MRSTICVLILIYSGSALAWPGLSSWEPLLEDGANMEDVEGDGVSALFVESAWDIVGTSAYPAAYWYVDSTTLYLRLRMSSDPSATGSFDIGCWGFVFETDGDESTYEHLVALSGGAETLFLNHNDDAEEGFEHVGVNLGSYSGAVAAGMVRSADAKTSLGDQDDYFVDLALPIADLVSYGVIDPTISFRVAGGSSDNEILMCRFFDHDVTAYNNGQRIAEVNSTLSDALTIDGDGEGLYYFDELAAGSDPDDADSDDDGLDDYEEVVTYGCDPTDEDSDGDGLDDDDEIETHGSDCNNSDTDGDGLSDYTEVTVHGSDPTSTDSDGDGLGDYDEITTHGSDPTSTDSDGDGLGDYDEVTTHGTDPTNPDSDNDGLDDARELDETGTDPTNPDSDGDGLTDGDEVDDLGSDPNSTDSDGDGLNDWDEVTVHGSDPNSADGDVDGLSDYDEVTIHGTDPANADSDGDGIEDPDELACGGADSDDRDGDGIPDATEGSSDTDHDGDPDWCDTDADGDGVADATEGTSDDDCDDLPNFQDTDDQDGPCADDATDDTGDPTSDDDKRDESEGGGCSAAPTTPHSALISLALLALALPRRRR